MRNKTASSLHNQLNKWIVVQFIDEIYNQKNLRHLSEFIHHDCQYCLEQTVIGEDFNEIQTHFAYMWVNHDNHFEAVSYQIDKVITRDDIVSIKLRRQGQPKSESDFTPVISRWEMFALSEGKIVQRWLATT